MDLLISMKAETIQKGLDLDCNIMLMPTAQSQGYFIAEFREADPENLRLLKQYGDWVVFSRILYDELMDIVGE
ncbi:MAG: hypothetical protein HYW01_08300 [Deltaproteobacteria bacterium]|nr:hypothetical protein [Deltaproteobacteria bacterium]